MGFYKELLMFTTPWPWWLIIYFLPSLIKNPVWRDSSCRQHLRRHLQRPGVPHFVPSRQLLSYTVSDLNTAPSVSGPESVTTLESQLHASRKKTAQSGLKTWLLNSYFPMASYLCPVNILQKHPDTHQWKSMMWSQIRYNAQPRAVFGWRSEIVRYWLLPGHL